MPNLKNAATGIRFALAAACAASPSIAAAGAGTTSAEFLRLPTGARAAALGGAYAAAADDSTAVTWNPAGLAALRGRSATFMHAAYLESSALEYAAYGQSLGRFGAAGAALRHFSAGEITETDAAGAEAGTFSPSDLAVSFAYAYELGRKPDPPQRRGAPGNSGAKHRARGRSAGRPGPPIAGDAGPGTAASGEAAHGDAPPAGEAAPGDPAASPLAGASAGIALHYVRTRIAESASAVAVDIGLRSPPLLDGRLRTAFAASNLGGTLRYDSEEEDLPRAYRFGAAFLLSETWLASLDLGLPEAESPGVSFGLEGLWRLGDRARAAARAGFDSRGLGGPGGLSGAAFGFGAGFGPLELDYAAIPFGALGVAHRASVTVAF